MKGDSREKRFAAALKRYCPTRGISPGQLLCRRHSESRPTCAGPETVRRRVSRAFRGRGRSATRSTAEAPSTTMTTKMMAMRTCSSCGLTVEVEAARCF